MKSLFDAHGAGSRLILLLLVFQFQARADQIVYDDALDNGWQDWSWSATRNFNYTGAYVHSGTRSISFTITNAWGALSLWHSAQDSSVFTNLTFWINGGPSGGQQLQIYTEVTGANEPAISLPTLAANTWQKLVFSLADLGIANQPNFIRFSIQDRTGGAQPIFYVDDISLITNAIVIPGTNAPVAVVVDAQQNRHPISPQIYGVAFASSNDLASLNFTMNRSGGNAETRYNWQLNAHNHAADWYFESIDDGNATPGATADDFVANSKNGGAQAMMTIPDDRLDAQARDRSRQAGELFHRQIRPASRQRLAMDARRRQRHHYQHVHCTSPTTIRTTQIS